MADEQKKDRHPSIECQVAAAKAQDLRQRAVKLRDATDIVIRLEYIYEAARRLQESGECQARGEDLANFLSALESEIKSREDKLKEARSSMKPIQYPGFVVGSEREKKLKRFMEENDLPTLLNTGDEILIVDPESVGKETTAKVQEDKNG